MRIGESVNQLVCGTDYSLDENIPHPRKGSVRTVVQSTKVISSYCQSDELELGVQAQVVRREDTWRLLAYCPAGMLTPQRLGSRSIGA